MAEKKTIEAGEEFDQVTIGVEPQQAEMSDGNYVNDLKKVIPINVVAPTHVPKKFVDCFYEDGTNDKFYAFIDNSWQQLALFSDVVAKASTGSMNRSTSGAVEVTTGFAPKLIRFTAFYPEAGAAMCWGTGTSNTDLHYCIYSVDNGAGLETRTRDTSNVINLSNVGTTKTLTAVISATSATSFTVTFTAAGTPATCQILWEAIG